MKATGISSLLLILLLLPAGPVLADFAGGDGSAEAPWQIATARQLDEIRNDLGAHYILTADIDLTRATGNASGAFWNGGAGWEPIGGSLGDSFIGSLDGNGFTITGLTIDRSGDSQAGLFGWISFGAKLSGLRLEAVDITGGSLVAGLVVTNFGGTVENSHVAGSVSGREFVGGLVARNLSGKVADSSVTGNVNGSDSTGGLVGINWSTVTGSDADTDIGSPVSGRQNAGNRFPGTVSISGTGMFNGVQGTGSIDAIRLPQAFDPAGARPGRGDGALTILGEQVRATMLPYRMQQASSGQGEGVYFNEDGDVVLITADGREVFSHPVLADSAVFNAALQQFGLELQYGESATMRLLPADDESGSADYFSARADMLAVAADSTKEGLFFRGVPGLQGASLAYLVFNDESGIPMQQELAPVPADWLAMKDSLAAIAGISDVRMDPQGIISVAVGGQTVRGRMEYEVSRSARNNGGTDGQVVLTPVGDANGDGTEDFRVQYPGGDTQLLLIFP